MKSKKTINRKLIILCALICIVAICATAAGTYAYLVHRSGTDSTQMIKPTISGDITGSDFKNLTVTNNGTIKVYVRVVPIINFTYVANNSSGDPSIYYCAEPPSTSTVTYRNGLTRSADYTIAYNTTDWIKGGDGYYYLKKPLGVNATSPKLINTFTVHRAKFRYDGHDYYLTGEAACEVIQCESMVVDTPAVESAWKVTLAGDSGSEISKVPTGDSDRY